MKSWTILLSTLCLFSCNQQENKFEKYVDPLIGTDIRSLKDDHGYGAYRGPDF